MKTCPVCNFNNPDTLKECAECAAFLEGVPASANVTLPDVAVMSNEAAAIYNRYRDAFLVSIATIRIGKIFQTVGLLGVVIIFSMDVAITKPYVDDSRLTLFFEGIFAALAAGGQCYLIGVLVSALGHILKAVLDGAVNSSPFLTDAQRMRIMSWGSM